MGWKGKFSTKHAPFPPVDIIWGSEQYDCLVDKREDYPLSELFCALLCMTVVHNDTQTHNEQFWKLSVGLGLSLVFVCLFSFSILFPVLA